LWLPAVANGVRSLGERALNPLTLKTEAERILRVCDTAIVAPESARSRRRSSSGEVVRAESLPCRAAADEQVLAMAGKAPSHSSRLLQGSVVRDFGSLGKRWRSL
jgi:hypothetical protein